MGLGSLVEVACRRSDLTNFLKNVALHRHSIDRRLLLKRFYNFLRNGCAQRKRPEMCVPRILLLRVNDYFTCFSRHQSIKCILMVAHFELVGDDQFRIDFSFRNQLFTLDPSVENPTTVNRVKGQTLEDNVVQKVIDMQRLPMQSDEHQLSALKTNFSSLNSRFQFSMMGFSYFLKQFEARVH